MRATVESVGFAWLTITNRGWLWLNVTYPSWHLEYHGLHYIPLKSPLTDGPNQPRLSLGNWILTRSYRLGLTLISLKLMWTSFESLELNRTSLHWWELPWNHLDFDRIQRDWFRWIEELSLLEHTLTYLDLLRLTALTAFRSVYLL